MEISKEELSVDTYSIPERKEESNEDYVKRLKSDLHLL